MHSPLRPLAYYLIGSLFMLGSLLTETAQSQTLTWSGTNSGDWDDIANWGGSGVPNGTQGLIFSGSTNVTTSNNILPSGVEILGITFNDSTSAAGNFILNGPSSIGLNGNIVVDTAAASQQTINLDIELLANAGLGVDSLAASSTLILAGVISDGGNGFSLSVDEALSDSTLAGTIEISGDNTFSGGFSMAEHRVLISHNNALGTGAVTMTDASDTNAGDPNLQLNNGINLANSITIENTGGDKRLSLVSGSTNTAEFSGLITLNENGDGNFEVHAGGTSNNLTTQVLTLSGQITGTGFDASEVAIRLLGDGTTVISNVNNDFTGDIKVDNAGSTLRIVNDAALSSADIILEETNGHVELANGVTVDNNLLVTSVGDQKILKLENGTGLSAEWSGTIQVDEPDPGNFELRSNSNGGNNDQTQILTVSGAITSTAGAGIELNTDGVVRLTGDNNISNTIELSNNGSILRVGHNNALGGAGGATTLLDNNNTRLQIEDSITTNAANNIIIGDNGTGTSTLEILDGSNGVAESATIAGNILIQETTDGTFDINAADALDTFSLTGIISNDVGATRIDLIGDGTKVFSGANSYDVETRLIGGVLVADNATALGNGGVIDFGGGILQYTAASAGTDWATRIQNSGSNISLDTNGNDVTLAGIIDATNTAGIRKIGSGTLTLSGANTYTGNNLVESGTLAIGATDSLNNLGNLNVGREESSSNAVFDLMGFDQTVSAISLGESSSTVGGLNHSIIDSSGGGLLTFTGNLNYNAGSASFLNGQATVAANIDLDGSSTLVINDGADDVDVLISGDITSSGNLTKQGTGTLRISGTNNATGFTNIDTGTLQIFEDANLGSNDVTLGDNATNGTLEYIGTGGTINNQFRVGENTAGETGGGSIINTGGGTLTLSSNTFNQARGNADVTRTVTFGGDSDIIVSGAIIDNNTAGGGLVSVEKIGTNTLILNGTNTNTGDTNINAGVLGGSGAIARALNIATGATHTAGTLGGAGAQTLGTSTSYANDSTIAWDLVANSNSNAGTDFDQFTIQSGGTLSFAATTDLEINFNGPGSTVDFTQWTEGGFWGTDKDWIVYTGDQTIDITNLALVNDPTNWIDSNGLDFDTSEIGQAGGSFGIFLGPGDTSVILRYSSAVPEPGSLSLLGIGVVAFGWVFRRRRVR